MTAFGQSIPALPKVYLDQNEYLFTKVAFLSHLVRSFQTVGMVPVTNIWPWDPIAVPEFAAPDPTVGIFPFDYPDPATFTVNNLVYRPCLAVCCWIGDTASAVVNTENNQRIGIFDCIRLDGVFDITQMFNLNRRRNPSDVNFGFRNATSDQYPAQTGTADDHVGGSFVHFPNWKPYASSGSATDVNILNVKYWFTYLGPAGLFIFVGSGNAEGQLGQYIACGFGFGGARIPGRELVPDVNINRVNPVFPLYLKATAAGGTHFDSTSGIYRTLIHGIQFDLSSTLEPVRAELLNLENTELPFYPTYRPNTVPSPRVVPGGEGAHILGRVVVVPTETESLVGQFYGPVVSEIRTTGVQPNFGQVYTCPKLTFSDLTAPLGVREDPTTLDDWYMVPSFNGLQRLGLFFENGITVSALATVVLTTVGTDNYTMAGPGGDGFTFPNLGGGLTPPSVVVTGDGVPATVDWDDSQNTGQIFPEIDDQMLALTVGALTNREAECTWTIPLSVSHPADTLYQIQFEARNRNGATTEGSNSLVFQVFNFGAYVTMLTLVSAGTNMVHASYNYQTFTFNVLLDTTAPPLTRRLVVRWIQNKQLAANGNTGTVRSVKVIRKRYL
jgi:hypothetical protein